MKPSTLIHERKKRNKVMETERLSAVQEKLNLIKIQNKTKMKLQQHCTQIAKEQNYPAGYKFEINLLQAILYSYF